MISKITQIKDFGSFKDFHWDGIEDFNKINLFFGWNYAGKTTLSRIFSSYERCENQYKGSHFSIEVDGQNIDDGDLDAISNIHVFNTDFIQRNIKWNSSEVESFAIIGEESNELKNKIDELEKQLYEKESLLKATKDIVNETNKQKDKFETDLARTIKTNLKMPNYNKTKLLANLSDISDDINDSILSDDCVQKDMKIINNDDVKEKIYPLSIKLRNLNNDYQIIHELCEKTISSERIQELIDNEKLSKWVQDGLPLNEGSSHCRFCGSLLDRSIIDRYHQHFSNEYKNLLADITNERNALCRVDYPVLVKEQFYPELRSDFIQCEKKIRKIIDDYNNNISVLMGMLDKKIANIFDSVICEPFNYDIDTSPIDEYNSVIAKNSETTDTFQKSKNEALSRLMKHIIADAIANSDYDAWKETVTEKNSIIDDIRNEITEIENELHDLKVKISNVDKAADCINSILEDYFNKNDIILVHENERFYLYRQGERAEKLSEGEQTAIAFSYFLARLRESDISDQIIFIDDPISSLDSNHLFLTYSMIVDLFYKNESLSCKQLFISTHNYEFFRFLFEVFDRNDKSSYLIKRVNNNGNHASTLENLPKVFSDYDSEYTYLFSRMIDFKNNPNNNFDQLYDIPNIVRKILDAYCQFRFQKKFMKSGNHLFSNTNDFQRVYKFVNHKSHTRTDGLMILPDLSECKDVVGIVISTIENNDKEHYDCVLEKINKAQK